MIKNESLDAVLETAMLLSIGNDLTHCKELIISSLTKNQIDGEQFHAMYLKEHEGFLTSFLAHSVFEEGDITFTTDEFELNGILFLPLLLQRSILTSLDGFDNSALQKLIITAHNDIYETKLQLPDHPSLEDLLHIVDQVTLDEKLKWIFLSVLRDPLPYYKKLVKVVNQNIPAFHQACEENPAYIENSIQSFEKHLPELYIKDGNYTVSPLISNPLSLLEIDSQVYCGVLFYQVLNFNSNKTMDSDELALILKVLADKNRLEIIKLLKEAPSYNLEIAHKLALSPATISHHMTTLILRKFVILDKRGGYTYYHLNQGMLTSFLQELNKHLL